MGFAFILLGPAIFSLFPNDSIYDLWMFALRYVHPSSADTPSVAGGNAFMEEIKVFVLSKSQVPALLIFNRPFD